MALQEGLKAGSFFLMSSVDIVPAFLVGWPSASHSIRDLLMESDTGMTSFTKLLVADGERSARFYEALGFERVQGEPPFLHLRWGGVADVYLVSTPAGAALQGRRGLGALVGFRAGPQGLQAVMERAQKIGVEVDESA